MIEISVVDTLTKLFKHKPSVQKGGEEVLFFCPNCKHYKRKLNINTNSGYYHCWVCNFSGKSFSTLLKKLNAPREYFDLLCKHKVKHDQLKKSEVKLMLPDTFKPLYKSSADIEYKHALSYCFKRGLTSHEIVRYNIGYCLDGNFRNRVVVPSYDDNGNLNFYCGRDFYESKMKYRLCESTKDIIGFELYTDFNQPLTLVEGVFDAFAVKYNAVPLFGKNLSNKLKIKLMSCRPPRVNVLLDNDALQSSLRICDFLLQNNIDTYLIRLEGKDPNEIGHKKTWQFIDSCDRLTESDLYSLKLKTIL